MTMALLEHPPVVPAVMSRVGGMGALVAEASACLERAARMPVESLSDEVLGGVVTELAVVESRAAALRMRLSAEADRRRVAEETAETGTDAWLARLTGSTRE